MIGMQENRIVDQGAHDWLVARWPDDLRHSTKQPDFLRRRGPSERRKMVGDETQFEMVAGPRTHLKFRPGLSCDGVSQLAWAALPTSRGRAIFSALSIDGETSEIFFSLIIV